MTRSRRRPRERGVALLSVGVSLAALLAVGVVAVDLGRLSHTATEVQNVADVAAAAGARALLKNSNAVAEAQAVALQNTVDGRTASLPPNGIRLGRWDAATGSFTAGGTPANAVRVTASATVQNVLAGLLGSPTTTVQKSATAAIGGPGAAPVVLPLAIGECHFETFRRSLRCADLPAFVDVPDAVDAVVFTALSAGRRGGRGIVRGLTGRCSGGASTATLRVGDEIAALNGQTTSILRALDRCLGRGLAEFAVPVVPCDGPRGRPMEVLGFATVRITAVRVNGARRGLDLSAVCETDTPAPPGGGLFGTGSVGLVG
jgi:Flp pilus assembly protein TadG